jgi:hypothetical protein
VHIAQRVVIVLVELDDLPCQLIRDNLTHLQVGLESLRVGRFRYDGPVVPLRDP